MTSTTPPRVLVPYDQREAITVREACEMSGRSDDTVRRWAAEHDLGRIVGGQWRLSRVALRIYLDGDRRALRAYLNGDRTSELVAGYLSAAAA